MTSCAQLSRLESGLVQGARLVLLAVRLYGRAHLVLQAHDRRSAARRLRVDDVEETEHALIDRLGLGVRLAREARVDEDHAQGVRLSEGAADVLDVQRDVRPAVLNRSGLSAGGAATVRI